MEILLKYIKEFKTKGEFNGVDFKADLSTSIQKYADAWRRVDFPADFGAEIVHEPGKEPGYEQPGIWILQKKSWKSTRGKSETAIKESRKKSFWLLCTYRPRTLGTGLYM